MRRVIIGIFSAIVLGILFIVLCTFIRRPYETILLDRFGKLIEEDHQVRLMYNWYFKMPTDSVVRIDKRLHLYTGPLQEIPMKGNLVISIRTYAAWRIVDPVKFVKSTNGSDQKAKDIMGLNLQGQVLKLLTYHGLDELFNTDETKLHTSEIEAEVARNASLGTVEEGVVKNGLNDQGLEIVQVGFSRIAFPPANADAVYNRMVTDLNRTAIDYDSRGQAAKVTLDAQGERDAAKIRSDALAEAEKIRGQGDQQALSILANVQKTDEAREAYIYWKGLDFAKNALQKNTILVLSTDGELLKSLFRAPVRGEPAGTATTRPDALGAVLSPKPEASTGGK